MSVGDLAVKAGQGISKWAVKNANKLFFGAGVGLGVACVVKAVKSKPKADERVAEIELDDPEDKVEKVVKTAKAVVPVYAPAAILGVGSIVCFGMSNRVLTKRQVGAAFAATTAESTLGYLADEVQDQLTPKKAQEAMENIGGRKLAEAPDPSDSVIEETGYGNTLCYDAVCGRYFRSDMEHLRQAENLIVKLCASEMSASVDEYHCELNLKPARVDRMIGWCMDGIQPDMKYSTHLKGDTPVLVVDYQIDPHYR